MEKDRNLRYKNAAEMKADLVKLRSKDGTEPTLRSGLREATGFHLSDDQDVPEVEFEAALDRPRGYLLALLSGDGSSWGVVGYPRNRRDGKCR